MYGELDCDILLTQTNGVTTYLYVHDGIVVYESRITDLGDGRTVSEERMLITDTSLDGTDVTGGRTNLGYVEAGSWFDYNIYINDSPFDSISYDVVSVDGDDAMVSVDGDEPVQMTVYQLLNGYPEGAGLRLIGQSVLETMWGNIVCDVYFLEAQYETHGRRGPLHGVSGRLLDGHLKPIRGVPAPRQNLSGSRHPSTLRSRTASYGRQYRCVYAQT